MTTILEGIAQAPAEVAAIVRAARDQGVDVWLALSTSWQESKFSATVVGDNGCSHGLFQLNTCGGEGAGMTLAQLQDPYTNASRALTEIGAVARAHPDWTPGQIAAAAQRPADQAGYARSVDSIYRTVAGAGIPASDGGTTNGLGVLPIGLPSPGDLLSGAAGFVDQFNPFSIASNFATSVGSDIIQGLFRLAVFGTLLAAGGTLIAMGAWRSVSPQTRDTIKGTAAAAGKAAAA